MIASMHERLAPLARVDPQLLSPVQHRSAQAQIHLTQIRARAELVKARTALVNSARGLVQQVGQELAMGLSPELREALDPLLREVESLNAQIKEYLIALTYVLTLDDPHRFRKFREAGCFVGLQPGRRQETSGGGGGAKASGTAASAVVGRRGVRTSAQ